MIWEGLAEGKSLRAICSEAGIPGRAIAAEVTSGFAVAGVGSKKGSMKRREVRRGRCLRKNGLIRTRLSRRWRHC